MATHKDDKKSDNVAKKKDLMLMSLAKLKE